MMNCCRAWRTRAVRRPAKPTRAKPTLATPTSAKQLRPRQASVMIANFNKARRPRMSQEQEGRRTLPACLQELHLTTMRRECEAVSRQAQQESWSYQEFLRELAEREVQQRRHNRI